ncbi:MAG: glycosyltransferase family 4 protein [Bryobacteraceae bacterium]|nr:glycosyltransferase family 4 protein [Bryobacteraceae bacterium]
MATLLHIIRRQTGGGAARAMWTMAQCSTGDGSYRHEFRSLLPADSRDALLVAMEHADIVVIHFWNTPELYAFLRSDLPPARLLLMPHIGGLHAPHVVTPELAGFADFVLAVSPFTFRLPALQRLPPERVGMCLSPADFSRLAGIRRRPHRAFNVGYVGTLSPVKMHPNFVAMSARIRVPNARFIVCGSPAGARRLLRDAAESEAAARFDFRGYVDQIGPVMAELDVLGYPLCEDNYSTSDLSVQEAMFLGVPPVIFPHGGAAELVRHNRTGLIVHSEREYSEAVERLYHDPAERRRLGRAARAYARRHFGAGKASLPLQAIYRRMLAWPKRARRLNDAPPSASGAELFAASVGDSAPQFRASLSAHDPSELLAADLRIAASSPVLQDEGSGGVFHYRNFCPRDEMLRLWSGLILMHLGQNARALSELQAALAFGCRHWRVSWYLAQAAARLRATPLALASLRDVVRAAPDFTEASRALRQWERHGAAP